MDYFFCKKIIQRCKIPISHPQQVSARACTARRTQIAPLCSAMLRRGGEVVRVLLRRGAVAENNSE